MIFLYLFCFIIVVGLILYIQLGPKLLNMQEGMWEITTEVKVPDKFTSESLRHKQCLTKEKPAPLISLPHYESRLSRRRHSSHILGNHVFWSLECEGQTRIQGSGRIKYSGDSLKGIMQMRTVGDKEGQKKFNVNISGIRIGKCE